MAESSVMPETRMYKVKTAQKLDVLANNLFIEALSQREVVCGIAY